ncbi:MAG: OmpA family protein [Alphaproteobacteria bacterium]|nr:OmpA family protein [Alphaproteobacteria bacterium]
MDLVSHLRLRSARLGGRAPYWAAAAVMACLLGAAGLLAQGIERRLEERARAALASEGADWATVEMAGRSAILMGTPPDERARLAAMRSVLVSSGSGWFQGVARVRLRSGPMSQVGAEPSTASSCDEPPPGFDPSVFRFDVGAAGLSRRQLDRISVMAAGLIACPNWELEIEGHTDAAGSTTANMRLSARRAEAVRIALIGEGVSGDRIRTAAFGASRPVRGSGGAIEADASRRIEIRLIRKEQRS